MTSENGAPLSFVHGPAAVKTALRDWLTSLGLLPHGDYPEGLH